MKNMTDRRAFLKTLAASAAATSFVHAKPKSDKLGPLLPTRKIGRLDEEICVYTLGGSHVRKAGIAQFGGEIKTTEALIEKSIELGVRAFDTARGYGQGESEQFYGRFLTPRYRDHIYLTTKTGASDGAKVRSHLEDSLRWMKTDVIDLWQIHSIMSPQDVDNRWKNGVIDEFLKARDEGKVRHIGFTGHVSTKAHLHMLKRLRDEGIKLDTCLMPMSLVDPHYDSFITEVLPELLKDGYGVFAMKTMAHGRLLGTDNGKPIDLFTESLGTTPVKAGLTARHMHHYAYSLPICSLCSGCMTIADLEENIQNLKAYKGMDNEERDRLLALAKPFAGPETERWKKSKA
ncbi:MAG: aldo/keto reductase [Verrucomicrobiota bacterium]